MSRPTEPAKTESVKIVLARPLTNQGTTLAELEMRRPKLKDHIAANKASNDELESECALFAALCGVNPEDMTEMDMADYRKLQEAYRGFLK